MYRARRASHHVRVVADRAPDQPAGPAHRRDKAVRWEKRGGQPAQYASLTSVTCNIIISFVKLHFIEQTAGQSIVQPFPELDSEYFGGWDAAFEPENVVVQVFMIDPVDDLFLHGVL